MRGDTGSVVAADGGTSAVDGGSDDSRSLSSRKDDRWFRRKPNVARGTATSCTVIKCDFVRPVWQYASDFGLATICGNGHASFGLTAVSHAPWLRSCSTTLGVALLCLVPALPQKHWVIAECLLSIGRRVRVRQPNINCAGEAQLFTWNVSEIEQC